jgi:hypothetical protein
MSNDTHPVGTRRWSIIVYALYISRRSRTHELPILACLQVLQFGVVQLEQKFRTFHGHYAMEDLRGRRIHNTRSP